METAVVCLAVATLVLSLVVGALAGSVPMLWWKCFRAEQKVEELDNVVAELLAAAGLRPSHRGERR